MAHMRGRLLFVFLAGCMTVLAFYAAAQGRPALRLLEPCKSEAQAMCEPSKPIMNSILICLKARTRWNENCLIVFAPERTSSAAKVIAET
jgi:hypothetical protein